MNNDNHGAALDRRALLLAAGAFGLASAGDAHSEDRPPAPRAELAFEAMVDIAPTLDLGEGPTGYRRMAPITGGTFEGPRLKGKVLPGGADRQLIRADGVRNLHATYELQTDDGAIISIDNRVTIDEPKDGPRYAYSLIDITAPKGPHDWLNKAVFVGTLMSMRPAREAVRVAVYKIV